MSRIGIDSSFCPLSIDHRTRDLYGGFYNPSSVRRIDWITGKSTIVIGHPTDPDHIHVNNDGHVLVSTCYPPSKVYEYDLSGKLIRKSIENFKVRSIDQSSNNHNVVVSSNEQVHILNQKLIKVHTFIGLETQREAFVSTSALFDKYGNLIISDLWNKEIYLLDGTKFSLIQKFEIDCLSYPHEIRLHKNILCIRCCEPDRIVSVDMSE